MEDAYGGMQCRICSQGGFKVKKYVNILDKGIDFSLKICYPRTLCEQDTKGTQVKILSRRAT